MALNAESKELTLRPDPPAVAEAELDAEGGVEGEVAGDDAGADGDGEAAVPQALKMRPATAMAARDVLRVFMVSSRSFRVEHRASDDVVS